MKQTVVSKQTVKKQSSPPVMSGKKPELHRKPVSEPVEPDEEIEGSKLPLVSVIDDQPTMDLCVELLKEAEECKNRYDKDGKRLKEIREELVGITSAFDLPGMRWGGIGLVYSGERTKLTLDKGKLMENGVTPEQIQASMKESKPFVDSRIVRVKF